MAGDASRVTVAQIAGTFTSQAQAHHQNFPEIRAEATTPKEAAGLLGNHLTRALDSALTDWRRDGLTAALEDVKAFIESC